MTNETPIFSVTMYQGDIPVQKQTLDRDSLEDQLSEALRNITDLSVMDLVRTAQAIVQAAMDGLRPEVEDPETSRAVGIEYLGTMELRPG